MKRKLKLFATRILKLMSILYYWAICILKPIIPNRIVFATTRHDALKDNLYYLFKEMKEAKPELAYVTLTQNINNRKKTWWSSIGYMAKVYYYLATARIFIIDDYYLPLYLIKVRKGTEVVQLWHASGPLKRVGLSLRGLPTGPSEEYIKVVPIHSNYNKVIVNSEAEIGIYSEAFGMPKERILALGSPRTDILFRNTNNKSKKDQFIDVYPEFQNKELVLYAPTFRGKSNDLNQYIPNLDMDKLIPMLIENNKVLIFQLHPYMKENMHLIKQMDSKAVFWNRGEYTIEELLIISDSMVTDYSSVIYDFAILEKPIALYCYDYEQYKKQRGFYINVKELIPTSFFTNEAALLNWIMTENKNVAEVKQVKVSNFKYKDGNASSRIIYSLFD